MTKANSSAGFDYYDDYNDLYEPEASQEDLKSKSDKKSVKPESNVNSNEGLIDKVSHLMNKMNEDKGKEKTEPKSALSEDKESKPKQGDAAFMGAAKNGPQAAPFKNTATNESVSEALGGAKDRNTPHGAQAASLNEQNAGFWQKTVALLAKLMEQIIRFFRNLFRRMTGKEPLVSKDRYDELLTAEKEKKANNSMAVDNLAKTLSERAIIEDVTPHVALWDNAFKEGPEAVQALFNERLKAIPNLNLTDKEAVLKAVLGEELLAVPGMRDKLNELKLFEKLDNAENKDQEMKAEQVEKEKSASKLDSDSLSSALLMKKLSETPNLDITDVKSVFGSLLSEEAMNAPEIQQMIQANQAELDYLKQGIEEVDPNIFKEVEYQLDPQEVKQLEQRLEKAITGNVPVNLLAETGIDIKQIAKQVMLPSIARLDMESFSDPKALDAEIFDMMETEAAYLSHLMQKDIEEMIANSDPLLDEVLIEVGAQEIISNLPNIERHSFLDHKLVAEIGGFISENHQDTLSIHAYTSMQVEGIAQESPHIAMQVQEEKEKGLRASAPVFNEYRYNMTAQLSPTGG